MSNIFTVLLIFFGFNITAVSAVFETPDVPHFAAAWILGVLGFTMFYAGLRRLIREAGEGR
ncbi:hypothetical protein [Sphingobium sp. Leaf26]|uniref:hypothetical protein n=1 Tax=Sphingobium sp. Leaf26 TaxID=1735693 RepID=UPI00138F11BB|nr:hypothetical protein [Sphingobium sp. Leaf26]